MQLAIEAERTLRGVVLLASPGRRIDQILLEQTSRAMSRHGFSDTETKRRADRLRRVLRLMVAGKSKRPPRRNQGLSKLAIRDLMRLDPIGLVRKLRLPVLICQGAKDIQISPERDALPLFLAAAERSTFSQLVILSDCDHLFKHEPKATPLPQRYFVPRPLSSTLLPVLRAWLEACRRLD